MPDFTRVCQSRRRTYPTCRYSLHSEILPSTPDSITSRRHRNAGSNRRLNRRNSFPGKRSFACFSSRICSMLTAIGFSMTTLFPACIRRMIGIPDRDRQKLHLRIGKNLLKLPVGPCMGSECGQILPPFRIAVAERHDFKQFAVLLQLRHMHKASGSSHSDNSDSNFPTHCSTLAHSFHSQENIPPFPAKEMDKSDFFLQKTNLSPPAVSGGHQKAKPQPARKRKRKAPRSETGKKKRTGAEGGGRTLMPLLAPDFESSASAIPPLRHCSCKIVPSVQITNFFLLFICFFPLRNYCMKTRESDGNPMKIVLFPLLILLLAGTSGCLFFLP